MSFSLAVKNELYNSIDNPRHCRFAELAAFTIMMGKVKYIDESFEIEYSSENELAIEAVYTLVKRLFGETLEINTEKGSIGSMRHVVTVNGDTAIEIVKAIKYSMEEEDIPDSAFLGLVMKSCCKRAYLRGAFLSAGTMSDPDKSYHLEINCKSEKQAQRIIDIMTSFETPGKLIIRQRYFSVYLKDSDQIIDFLGILGARVCLLEMENAKIMHSMRETVNRKFNCEMANINKTAVAAAKQIDDIQYINDNMGFNALPNGLDEVAKIRLKYPTATLNELAERMDPPVSKSCINHRLRKLSSIAEDLRGEKERELL